MFGIFIVVQWKILVWKVYGCEMFTDKIVDDLCWLPVTASRTAQGSQSLPTGASRHLVRPRVLQPRHIQQTALPVHWLHFRPPVLALQRLSQVQVGNCNIFNKHLHHYHRESTDNIARISCQYNQMLHSKRWSRGKEGYYFFPPKGSYLQIVFDLPKFFSLI